MLTVTKLLHVAWLLVCYLWVEGSPLDRPVVYPGYRNGTNRDGVMFPNSGNRKLEPQLDDNGNPICVKSSSSDTYCESVPNYPAVRKLMTYSPKEFQNMFGFKGISTRRTISNDDLSEEALCDTRSPVIFPKVAKNEENKWRYVINDIDYVQAVVTEQCTNTGSACAYVQDNLPTGYTSICKQRFGYKKLVAIHPEETKMYSDSFRFPSCCNCYVKTPFNARTGRRPNAGTSPARRRNQK